MDEARRIAAGLVVLAGLLIVFVAPAVRLRMRKPKPKDEDWFIREAGEIYRLAMEWNEPDGRPHGELRAVLAEKIGKYNTESAKVGSWKHRCPQKFSFEYLGIAEKNAYTAEAAEKKGE